MQHMKQIKNEQGLSAFVPNSEYLASRVENDHLYHLLKTNGSGIELIAQFMPYESLYSLFTEGRQ